MSSFKIKSTLEQYFIDNWTQTQIQNDGQTIEYTGIDSFISLKYVGIGNKSLLGSQSTSAQLQIFCYAKSTTLAYKLSDDVATFIKCKDLDNDVHSTVPQQTGSALNLDGEFFEVMIYVPVYCYS